MVICPVCKESGNRNPETGNRKPETGFNQDDTCIECRKEIGLISALDRIYSILDERD